MAKKVEKRTTKKIMSKSTPKTKVKKPVARKAARKPSEPAAVTIPVSRFYGYISACIETLYGTKDPAELRAQAAVGKELAEKAYKEAVANDLKAKELKYVSAADKMRIVNASLAQAHSTLRKIETNKKSGRTPENMLRMLAKFSEGSEGLEHLTKICASSSKESHKDMLAQERKLKAEIDAYKRLVAEKGEEAAADELVVKACADMKERAAKSLEDIKTAKQKIKALEGAAQLLERLAAETGKA
jgi:hypothetical protein